MTNWWVAPLTERAGDTEGIQQFAWTDHDGWHVAATLPERSVPTGVIWGWGDSVWAYWREERDRVQGVLLREADQASSPRWVAAQASRIGSSGKPSLPALHREPRFFRTDDGDSRRWRGVPARIIRVTEPTRIDLVEVG